MSTRSMTVLLSPQGAAIRLYRHCDGYPAAAGSDLADALAGGGEVADVAVRLLALRDEGARGPRPRYERVDHRPQDQWDLEHVYVVERDDGGLGFAMTHYARGQFRPTAEDFESWPHVRRVEPDWRAFVDEKKATLRERGGRP